MRIGALLVLAFTACSLPAGRAQDPGAVPTAFWLSLDAVTNQVAALSLYPTVPGRVYEVLSDCNLGDPWVSEGLLVAADAQTAAQIAISDRTNQLFFCARSFPTNGQLLITLADQGAPVADIDGLLQTLSPFVSNTFSADLPRYSLNLGYDAGDDGMTNIALLDPQNVVAIDGFVPGMSDFTNLCLSHNPVTLLDLHGLPSLQDVECYQCTNLASVNLTNCPSLVRVCLEQCAVQGTLDFTGDTNLADIRAAENGYTNIVFGGAGSNVWHLCIHDNQQLQCDVPLGNFPALQVLLAASANQHGALAPVSPQLWDLDSEANYYEFADLSNLPQLEFVFLNDNSLTNLVFDGSPGVGYLRASRNQLDTSALDYILTNIDGSAQPYGYLDLTANAATPSPIGYAAVTNLLAKGWEVYVDY